MPFLETMPALADEIIFEEGLRLKPYRDTVGKWTCGVGHLLTKKDGTLAGDGQPTFQTWTREQALAHLDGDLTTIVRGINKALPWAHTLDPIRERVLINMGFQLGLDGLLAFKDTLALIRVGNYSQAADHMLASKVGSKQAPARWLRLATRMRTGRYFVNAPKETK